MKKNGRINKVGRGVGRGVVILGIMSLFPYGGRKIFPAKFFNLGQDGRRVRRWWRLMREWVGEAFGVGVESKDGAIAVRYATVVHIVLAGIVIMLGVVGVRYAVKMGALLLYGVK